LPAREQCRGGAACPRLEIKSPELTFHPGLGAGVIGFFFFLSFFLSFYLGVLIFVCLFFACEFSFHYL
jgi:hypothetical protein